MTRSRPVVQPVSARHRAATLFAEGMSRAEVARVLGVCRATTSHWYSVWRQGGTQALVTPLPRGRRPRIEAGALKDVQRLISRSPRKCGFDLDTWSLAAVVAVIHRSTGIAYHPRHVSRVLRRTGWVLPPVGRTARHAFRQLACRDPEGNELFLRQRWSED